MSFADDDVCGGSIVSGVGVLVQGRCLKGGGEGPESGDGGERDEPG